MQHITLHTIQRVHVGWVGGGGLLLLILLIHKGGNSRAMVKIPLQACIYRDHIPFLFRFWISLLWSTFNNLWLFAHYEKSPFIYKISIALILFLPGLPNFTAYKVIWKLEISINMYVDCLKRDYCKLIMYWFELK